MPGKYRIWDVVNYINSPRDAFFYLEAAAEDDDVDGDLIRLAWSDIERAHNAGKISINIAMNGEELSRTLQGYGVYETAIPKITCALGMSVQISD